MVRPRDRHATVRVFGFMSANQAAFPVSAMARVLGVSKAGYYAWAGRPPSARAQADAALLKRIKTIHLGSRETYGSPRIHAELRGLGERHSRKRIARLMRQAGLVGASHRRGGPVRTRRDQEARPAPDLVDRNFVAEAPNQLPPRPPGRVSFRDRIIRLLTDDGWPTSPSCPLPPASSISPSCWMPSAAASSAGAWPIISGPSWCSTRLRWRSANGGHVRSFIIATRASQ